MSERVGRCVEEKLVGMGEFSTSDIIKVMHGCGDEDANRSDARQFISANKQSLVSGGHDDEKGLTYRFVPNVHGESKLSTIDWIKKSMAWRSNHDCE